MTKKLTRAQENTIQHFYDGAKTLPLGSSAVVDEHPVTNETSSEDEFNPVKWRSELKEFQKQMDILPAEQIVHAVKEAFDHQYAHYFPQEMAEVLVPVAKRRDIDRVPVIEELFKMHNFNGDMAASNSNLKTVGEQLYDLRNSGSREEQLAMRHDMAKALSNLHCRGGYGNDESAQQQKDLTKYKIGNLYNPTKSILKNRGGR